MLNILQVWERPQLVSCCIRTLATVKVYLLCSPNRISVYCGDSLSTLQVGFLLVPELLALLHNSVPQCQHFPWGHCCSIGWPMLWGFPHPLPCLLPSMSSAPSPNNLWRSQLGCLASSPLPLWKCATELYICPGRYWEDTLSLSCSELTMNGQTPGGGQCRWLSGESLAMVRSKHKQRWISSVGVGNLECLSLSLSSFLIPHMGNWGSVKGQLRCSFPYGEEPPEEAQGCFFQAGAEGVKGSLSFTGVCSYGTWSLLKSEHLF